MDISIENIQSPFETATYKKIDMINHKILLFSDSGIIILLLMMILEQLFHFLGLFFSCG